MPKSLVHLFRWSSFWSWWVCKQAKLLHLGHRKPARMHWKADALKTSHCLVRILVQRHNWAIFLRKWARWSLSDNVERIFVHKNWKGGYFQHLVSTGRRCVAHNRSYTRCFVPCFWRSPCQPHSWCRLIPLDYYLWGVVKDKCYADKPETIDALKDNICEAIGEILLHTIDNVLKNWTDRADQPRQPFKWNYFPLLTIKRIVLSNKKREKIFSSFSKAFSKKKVFGGSSVESLLQKRRTRYIVEITNMRLRSTLFSETYFVYFSLQ